MKVFKDCGFRIIIQANLRTINFLYIQINLDTSTHHSNRKLDNNPFYLNKNSKHPTTILKQLPKLIEKTYIRYIFKRKYFHSINNYVSRYFTKECFYITTQIYCKQ